MTVKFRGIGLLCLAATFLAASGGQFDPETTQRGVAYQIDIQDSANRFLTVNRLVVVAGDRKLEIETSKGLARSNQHRLDYSGVPLIGKFSEHRYDKDDFADVRRAGVLRLQGRTLIFDLADAPEKLSDIQVVAVLNQDFAYESRARIVADSWRRSGADDGGADAGEIVGEVYRADGGRLAGLIRPFVVTNSSLW